MREQAIKENGAWDFYQEEISIMNSLPDGKAYYDHVFSLEMDRSNPKNSYIAYVAGKVDVVDFTKPCVFTKEATALPDIDTDFPTDFREEVINYVKEKYGKDRVCQIVTFGRLAGRSALKAVLRTCEICDAYTQNEITEFIPDEAAISDQLEEMDDPSILLWALENVKQIHDYAYIDDEGEIHGDYAEAFKQAILLEGTFQNTGKHAAGVIISSEKIADIAPMSLSKDGIPIASLDMGDLEKVGLVKFDFLGVDILNKIYAVMGTSILGVPLNDPETWSLIQSGNTKGFFQLEGKLGMDWSKELKPENIEQLAALTAIIRPGTLASKDSSNRSMTKVYCDRKNRVEKVPEGIANSVIDTYGVLIYQETLLKICKELAGFTSADAIKMMKCISADSIVYTKNGPKRIDKTTNNDFILNIVNGKENYSKIKRVWPTGKRKVLRISTSNGFSIDLTENHQVMTNVGWLQAKDITKDHFVMIPKKYNPQGNHFIRSNLVILMAYFLSEGCYTEKSTNPKITNKDISVIELLEKIIISEFGQGQCNRYTHKNGVIDLRLLDQARIFITEVFSKANSKDKFIPNSIMFADQSVKRTFVSCFFNAEGSFNIGKKNTIEVSSASINMIRQIQTILLQDGIHAGLCVIYNKKYDRNYYRLTISSMNDIKTFISLYLDFVSYDKKNIFEQLITNKKCINNTDVKKTRIPKNIIESCFGKGVLREKTRGKFKVTREDYSTLSIEKATKLNQFVKSKVLDELITSDFYYVQVNSNKELEDEVLVYDYETEDDTHCGFINGILVHNSVGKKDAKLLFSLEEKFLSGCKLVDKISENEAKQLFENIKHSSRYLFNKSHSVEYSIVSYWSAYTKKTKPLEFYKEWLSASDRKLDPHAEVRNLVISARSDGIEIVPPSARYMTSNFFIRDGKVHFGLTHVKGVSAYELDQLWSLMTEHGVMINPTQLLVNILPQINKRTCEALIRVGAFDYLGIARIKLLHYYTCTHMLTKNELKFFQNTTDDLKDIIGLALATKKEGGAAASVTRLEKLKSIAQMITNPGRSLDDTPIMIATTEEELIGIPLSCSYMDSCLNATNADTTCREFKRGKSGKMSLAVRVKEVKEHLMKDGESKMAFLTVEDDTAEVSDIVIFKEEYKNFGRFLYSGAFVGIIGEKGKKNSLVVSRVVEL